MTRTKPPASHATLPVRNVSTKRRPDLSKIEDAML
jgi:hypothetical protein